MTDTLFIPLDRLSRESLREPVGGVAAVAMADASQSEARGSAAAVQADVVVGERVAPSPDPAAPETMDDASASPPWRPSLREMLVESAPSASTAAAPLSRSAPSSSVAPVPTSLSAPPSPSSPVMEGQSRSSVSPQPLSDGGAGVYIAHYYARLPGDANVNPYTRMGSGGEHG